MTSDERALRDREIIVARLSGMGAGQVVAMLGVSTRTVRRVWQRYQEGEILLDDDALEPLARIYAKLASRLRSLQDAEEDREPSHFPDSEQLEIAVNLVIIGRALGKPTAAHEMRLSLDEIREFNARVRTVLKAHQVPPEVIEEATDVNIDPFFEKRGITPGPGLP